MNPKPTSDNHQLNALLGLDGKLSAGSDLNRLRDTPRLDPARKQAAWEKIEERLNADLDTDASNPVVEFPARRDRSRGLYSGLSAAAAVLLIVVGAVFLFRENPAAGLPGTVAAVAGQVTRDGVALQKGDVLRPGDEVRTGPAGRLDFIVDGKNAFRLFASAHMVYEIETGQARLDIRRGYLAAIIRKRDALGTLELATGPVVSRVTGTILFVGAPDEHSGYVCICHGRIQVVDREFADFGGGRRHTPRTSADSMGTVRPRQALHHYAGIFTREPDGPVQELPGDMRYHDDAMLEGLAELVDESIDWTRL